MDNATLLLNLKSLLASTFQIIEYTDPQFSKDSFMVSNSGITYRVLINDIDSKPLVSLKSTTPTRDQNFEDELQKILGSDASYQIAFSNYGMSYL